MIMDAQMDLTEAAAARTAACGVIIAREPMIIACGVVAIVTIDGAAYCDRHHGHILEILHTSLKGEDDAHL